MDESRKVLARKRIALVAHDRKKKDLLEWAIYNKTSLARHELLATGTTGKMLEEKLDRPVKKMLSGPLGGDQQIGAMIATGEIDVLIFFWDPMEAQPHDSDVKALLRLAVAWNIPTACNRTTADFLLTSPLMQVDYATQLPDYYDYLRRPLQ
jgi:methylglyoxal synthase